MNPDWSSYYPQGAEYQAYLVALADKHGLREHARFRTEVEALWWDEDRGQWQIHSVDRDGNRDVSYAACRGHRCRLPQPAALAGPAGPGHVRGHQHSLRAVGSVAGSHG